MYHEINVDRGYNEIQYDLNIFSHTFMFDLDFNLFAEKKIPSVFAYGEIQFTFMYVKKFLLDFVICPTFTLRA